eukprot:COSAG02_NODE_6723_length_3401_cov_1.704119_2_plen_254_part_00
MGSCSSAPEPSTSPLAFPAQPHTHAQEPRSAPLRVATSRRCGRATVCGPPPRADRHRSPTDFHRALMPFRASAANLSRRPAASSASTALKQCPCHPPRACERSASAAISPHRLPTLDGTAPQPFFLPPRPPASHRACSSTPALQHSTLPRSTLSSSTSYSTPRPSHRATGCKSVFGNFSSDIAKDTAIHGLFGLRNILGISHTIPNTILSEFGISTPREEMKNDLQYIILKELPTEQTTDHRRSQNHGIVNVS